MTTGNDSAGPVSYLQNTCPVFSDIPERYLIELECEGSVRTYRMETGDRLIIQRRLDIDESLVVLEGSAVTLGADDRDGSAAHNSPCHPVSLVHATTEVVALSNARVCRFARDTPDYLVSGSGMLSALPPEDEKLRVWLRGLRYPAIFMHLPFSHISEVYRRMVRRPVKTGEEIIRQGEQGDLFFVIESGQAEVWQQDIYDEEQKMVGLRGPGDHVGDDALVSGGTRNATVRMATDGAVLTLSKADFKALISEPMVDEVETPAAKALAAQGHQYLDVRYEEEWEDGHIPGARLLPLTSIREKLAGLDRNGYFSIYCLSGKRSAVAAMILKARGFNVVSMEDGLREWPDATVTD